MCFSMRTGIDFFEAVPIKTLMELFSVFILETNYSFTKNKNIRALSLKLKKAKMKIIQ